MRLDRAAWAGAGVKHALRALASFAKLRRKYVDFEVAIDLEPEPGLADSGDLNLDLADLLVAVGQAARERETAVVLIVDELQYVAEEQLAALISALHRADQLRLPITLVGAGLPQLLGQLERASSCPQRLFEFVSLGPLDEVAAAEAIRVPVKREDEEITPEAVAAIVHDTQGYPYFLQEWGKHSWDVAASSPITAADVDAARAAALAELDASFFRIRFDRLTPAEKRYLRAMAALGPGPHRSGDIADQMQVKVSSIAPTRNSLIAKGMLFSPAHGDTAFTVPLFDQFMQRVMPDGQIS